MQTAAFGFRVPERTDGVFLLSGVFFWLVDVVNVFVVFPFFLCLRLRGNQAGTFRGGHHGKAVIKKIADIAEIVRVIFVFSLVSVLFVLIQKITSRSDFRSRIRIAASFLLFPKKCEKLRKMLFISKFHSRKRSVFQACFRPQDSLLNQSRRTETARQAVRRFRLFS